MSSSHVRREGHAAHHPAINDIRDLLTFRIAILAAATDRVGQRWLGDEFNLRITEWRVIGIIAARQPVRFLDVAKTLILDKGQLSRIVKSLATRGLIHSEPDTEDQRTIRLLLTPDGVELHKNVLARAFERNQRAVAPLEPKEVETLFTLLDKLQPFMTERAATNLPEK